MAHPLFLAIVILLGSLPLVGCSTAKIEARLEADPQCKPIINPKTGSLMPCPGTEKGFYASLGLTASKLENVPNRSAETVLTTSAPQAPVKPSLECKPQLHKKTGTALPCPVD